ncbi:hypothetical protein ACFX1T_027281 [Malus domestica]
MDSLKGCKLSVIFLTKCIRHYIGMFGMIFDRAVIVSDKFHPSSLPQVQVSLSKDILEALMISKDAALLTVQVMSPNLQSEHYRSSSKS